MAELSEGTLVAKIYRVRELLGSGGFGTAWLAENTTLKGGEVVVKTVSSADQGLDEAQVLVRLQSPCVVRVLAFDEVYRAIVMEKAAGESLARQLDTVDVLTAMRVARDVASALSELEALQLVHRDVKPENIVVEQRDVDGRLRVKLIDFGTTLKAGKPLTTDPIGSPAYCPAEQGDRNVPPHPGDDVYALGGVLFHLLTRRPPYLAPSLTEAQRRALLTQSGLSEDASTGVVEAIQLLSQHRFAPVPSVLEAVGEAPRKDREQHLLERLDELVGRMLAKQRADRPRAREVEAALEAMASDFSDAATNIARLTDLLPKRRPTQTLVMPKARLVAPAPGNAPGPSTAQLVAQVQAPASRRGAVVGVAALLVVGGVVAFAFSRPRPGVEQLPEPRPQVTPPPVVVGVPDASEEAHALAPLPLVPIAEAPVDAGAQVADVDVLAPLKGPAKVPRCTPDADWHRDMELTLRELGTLSARDEALSRRYDQVEPALGRLIIDANDPFECAKAEKQLNALKRLIVGNP